MAVITITITESPLQKHAGIPSTVTLDTNVPATIFYTLDGTDPDTTSNVYVGPIKMPGQNTVTLKVFATDGTDSSSIITETYGTNIATVRFPRDKVVSVENLNNKATFPYGSPAAALNPVTVYGGVGGTVYDNLLEPRQADGYDGFGNQANFYTPPKDQFDFIFSETNSIGERGEGIGTVPAKVLKIYPRNNNEVPQSSDANSAFFNPKALVIFQDSRDEPFDEGVNRVNRPYFSLESASTVRDGALLRSDEAIAPSGSLLRQFHNPKDNTMNYYYYDNRTNRWIISKEPYVPNQNTVSNIASVVFSNRTPGDRFVYPWATFKYHKLLT